MSTETLNNTEIIKVEEITSIMANAGAVLSANVALSEKAAVKGRALVDTSASGMSAELDAEMNIWQVNAKKALDILNNRRAPITQMANQIVKAFTALEAPIDPKKAGSVYEQVQTIRNGWAKSENERIRKEQEAIQKKQQAEKERIELKSRIEENLRMSFQDYILKAKSYLNEMFEKITLETFDQGSEWLKNFNVIFKIDKWDTFKPNVTAVHLTPEEFENVILNVKSGLFDEFAAVYRENMEDSKQALIDKLPSKKIELEEIAKAGEKKRKELEEEAERRKQAEIDRLAKDAEDAKKAEQEKINTQKQIDQAENLFTAAAELSEVSGPSGKSRTGYKITVKNNSGWGAIFMFYFEKEGPSLNVEDFGKKTMNQMKAFCEKHAHKTGELIISQHLAYEEDFKAVATKEK